MMPLPSELISFDFKPHMHSMLVKSFGDHTAELQKLEDFVARLEEERLKIDAFKRELPLCMQLLTNAMEASRQQLQTQKASQLGATVTPVLEEFMPIKSPNSSNAENEGKADKANWMTSAQLWNQESEQTNGSQLILTSHDHHEETDIKLGLNGKAQRTNGCAAPGAFNPFGSKDSITCSEGFPELALASSTDSKKNSPEQRDNPGKYSNCNTTDQKEASTSSGQAHRKARRCWSPDLHRRFVNALHMLGGSQVATPKQIRELMKVDGLTNDEVKSHLQKFRLHTRRPSPSPQQTVTAAPPVVVLGGIWVPPEYAAAAAAAHGGAPTAALYGPHAAAASYHHHVSPPPPFCSLSQAQGSYPQPPHPGHQQLHLYSSNKPPLSMQKSGSPERGVTGDRSESIEDGKSESGSWKADSGGENGGEKLEMDGGDESNASVRRVKF